MIGLIAIDAVKLSGLSERVREVRFVCLEAASTVTESQGKSLVTLGELREVV